jgi:hypothetical protein
LSLACVGLRDRMAGSRLPNMPIWEALTGELLYGTIKPVFQIRIRIHMFLGLPDLDPSIIKQN